MFVGLYLVHLEEKGISAVLKSACFHCKLLNYLSIFFFALTWLLVLTFMLSDPTK